MVKLIELFSNPFKINRHKKFRTFNGSTKSDGARCLKRQMNLIKSKHPGQSIEWYLQKIVYDLEKDRNRMRGFVYNFE